MKPLTSTELRFPFKGIFPYPTRRGVPQLGLLWRSWADQGEIIGYGEGLPVESVTGETPETVMKDVASLAGKEFFPKNLRGISQIWDFVERLPDGKEHNAALCGLEMALLDALGKEQKQSILAYLPQHLSTPCIQYGAAITLGDRART